MPNECVIGVDVGGTKILVGIVRRDGTVAARREHRTQTESQDHLLAQLDAAVEDLLDDDVVAVGFGIPSRIDQRAGRVVASANVPLLDVDLGDRMERRFGLPIAIENDANAATIAEWAAGAGRGTRHMVMLTLGTGVGGGLILDGRPYRGSIGAGGELGHMVLEYGGAPCQGSCTGRGHLEVLASGHAADALARTLLGARATAHDLVDRARAGEEPSREALTELGRRLGAAIGSLVNIFDPEVVVVGGGFAAGAGDLLLQPAREIAAREALVPARDVVRIVPAQLGPEAGLVGAGLVAFEVLDAAA